MDLSDLMVLEQMSRKILIVLLNTSFKGLLIILGVYVLLLYSKKISAKTLHLVWFLSIACLLVLPVSSLLLPPIRNGVFQLQEGSGKVYQTFASVISIDMSPAVNSQMLETQFNPENSELSAVPPMFQWTLGLVVWLAGALLTFSRSCCGHIKAINIVRNSTPVQQTKMMSLLSDMCVKNNLNRSVLLSSSTEITSPFTIGFFKPVIVIPEEMEKWAIADIKPVLLHEILHIIRSDYLTQTVSILICSIYWFVPVVWIACKKLYSEQENACDEEVIRKGIAPGHYVNQMFKIACSAADSNTAPGLFFMKGRRKLFEKRIKTILKKRGAIMKKKSIMYVFCFCIIAVSSNLLCVAQETYNFKFPEYEEPIYGTWINTTYKGDVNYPQKNVFTTWGFGQTYHKTTDTGFSSDFTFILVEKWKDSRGNTLYLVFTQFRGGKAYNLTRISKDGNVFETVNGAGFPEERDLKPKNALYRIYYRQ